MKWAAFRKSTLMDFIPSPSGTWTVVCDVYGNHLAIFQSQDPSVKNAIFVADDESRVTLISLEVVYKAATVRLAEPVG